MGQYFIPVNVTKKEYIHAHAFGDGLKMGEWTYPTSRTSKALKLLKETRWKGDEVIDLVGDYQDEELYREARETFTDVSEIAKAMLNNQPLPEAKPPRNPNVIRCFDVDCSGNKDDLRYVMKSVEFHSLSTMPDDDGYCDLNSLEDSHADELFEPYIHCLRCQCDFNLDGSRKI